jgi:hypothetical protein
MQLGQDLRRIEQCKSVTRAVATDQIGELAE